MPSTNPNHNNTPTRSHTRQVLTRDACTKTYSKMNRLPYGEKINGSSGEIKRPLGDGVACSLALQQHHTTEEHDCTYNIQTAYVLKIQYSLEY